MKKCKMWMLAAILICGAMSTVLTSCANADEPVIPVEPTEPTEQKEMSKYTIAQIVSEVQGFSVDPVMFVFANQMRLYDIDTDGKCDVYDLTFDDEGENNDDIVEVTQYSGTWQATNSLTRLHFIDELDLEGYDLMGGLMLHTKMHLDEDDQTVSQLTNENVPNVIEEYDTLAVLRDQEDGELLFLDKDDVNLIVMLNEMGMLSNNAGVRTRAPGFSEEVWKSVMEKIKDITEGETFRTFVNPYLGNKFNANLGDWMGNFYKNLNPRIADMSILGANQAVTGSIPDGLDPAIGNVKTQFRSLSRLWNYGVRYFDLGTCILGTDGELYFHNYEWNYTQPLTLKKVLGYLKELIEKHPAETAILMFDNPDGTEDYASVIEKINALVQSELKDHLMTNYGPDVRLNECRGKFILMNRFADNNSKIQMGLNLREAWKNNMSNGEANLTFPGTGKTWVNVYANKVLDPKKPGQAKAKQDQVMEALDKASLSAKDDVPEWFIINLAGCYKHDNYLNFSQNAYYQNKFLDEHFDQVKGKKTGIIVMDFVGPEDMRKCPHINYRLYGQKLPTYVTGNNFLLVRDHKIQLDNNDSPE